MPDNPNISITQWPTVTVVIPCRNAERHIAHTLDMVLSSEWNFPYSREKAAMPAPWLRQIKFWPSVARLDNASGDRNLVCSCIPVEAYT